jgi:hypothetical protein
MLIKKVSAPMRAQNIAQHHCMLEMLTTYTGRRRPQAPRAQPQGQGQQVPPDSHRVPHPPPVPLLQDRRQPPAHLEIRERYCQHSCRLSGLCWSCGCGGDSERFEHGVGGGKHRQLWHCQSQICRCGRATASTASSMKMTFSAWSVPGRSTHTTQTLPISCQDY